MKGLLVFDHLNDVVYTNYNKKFANHINEFAAAQGLVKPDEACNRIEDDIIVQIFSPIITSQRIMNCQFGNSYTSIQCEDGLNICFDEFMGYLFVSLGPNDVAWIKKCLSVCITIVRYLCGPDVYQLKSSNETSKLATRLIDSWLKLNKTDQAIYVEAVEQLAVNSDLSLSALQSLKKSTGKLLTNVDCSNVHALILVRTKFFSLYSSQNARELSPQDILFSIILSEAVSSQNKMESFQVLLSGCDANPSCLTHVMHVIPICEGINLIYFLEVGNLAVSSSIYETFCHLHTIQFVQIQREPETLRPAFDNLDTAVKKLGDALKKNKNQSIDSCFKQMYKKWEIIRKKYLDFIKNKSDEALLRAETLVLGFLENLKQLLSLTSVDKTVLNGSQKQAVEAAQIVVEKLDSCTEFLKVKAMRNFPLGSRDSLTINKYLEEFPGLVHFLYLDRNNHRIMAPTLDFGPDETSKLTKNKIWTMIKFSRNHLQEGNLSLMWKDTIFNYSYFLWFEDSGGAPLKPVVFPTNSTKALPLPGLFGEDFYRKLIEACFPKTASRKVRCYELYCVHLGLVTSSCVLEHTRRLSATIWELRGPPAHPIDLL